MRAPGRSLYFFDAPSKFWGPLCASPVHLHPCPRALTVWGGRGETAWEFGARVGGGGSGSRWAEEGLRRGLPLGGAGRLVLEGWGSVEAPGGEWGRCS